MRAHRLVKYYSPRNGGCRTQRLRHVSGTLFSQAFRRRAPRASVAAAVVVVVLPMLSFVLTTESLRRREAAACYRNCRHGWKKAPLCFPLFPPTRTTPLREKMRKMARAAFRARAPSSACRRFLRVPSSVSRRACRTDVIHHGRSGRSSGRSSHFAPPRFIFTAKTGLDEGYSHELFQRSATSGEYFFQRPRSRKWTGRSSRVDGGGGGFAGGVTNITRNARRSVQGPVTGEFTRDSPLTITLG